MSRLSTEDEQALDDLASAYGAAVDDRDWDRLATLFTEDAVLLSPDPPRSREPVLESRGRDAIVATVQQVAAFARTLHQVSSTSWTGEGGTASGRTRGEAHHVVEDAEPHAWVWDVEYADECVRTDGRWRLARRALTVRMIEKRPVG